MSTTTTPSLATRFWAMARRPRWIAGLLLCLGLAAGFAGFAQWQFERSVENTDVVEIDTETPVALVDILEPGRGLTETEAGRTVTVAGELVADDFLVLTGRHDGTGATGTWLVGHLVTPEGASLAVALGFSPGDAAPAIPDDADRSEWVGRILPDEEPQSSDFEAGERSALASSELVNLWDEPGPTYSAFLVAAEPSDGLEPIVAVAPEREVSINLLNLFYAIEWVLFGGFAIYLWYRLVRDAVEREDELAAAGGAPAPTVD